jgi:flagellar hook protein FlgE
MGLLSSLFSGVSGLNSTGSAISIVGDNIANTNTVGFKGSRPEFVDVLAGSFGTGGSGQIGAGSRMSGVNQNFTQGSLESTGVQTDLAIDGGGFFITQDSTGVYYTRAGVFRLNDQQELINSGGQQVLGFGITPGGEPNGALGTIDLSTLASVPQATGLVEANVNLDPNTSVIPGGFDHTDPINSSNFQTGIRIYDSLGNPRNILIYFRKTAANTWEWYAGANRGDLDLTSDFPGASATPPNQFFPIQSGSLTFTSNGELQLEDTTAVNLDYDLDGDGTLDGGATATPQAWDFGGGPTANQAINFDFGQSIAQGGNGADRTTQFGGQVISNSVRFMNQDGFPAGSLSSISIDENGFVTGQFSNGVSNALAQIALADFPNVTGLERVGDNAWIESNGSGNPIIGSPNQSGFGAVRSGFLELSNVDMAAEFVKLILSQRAFQANTRTISTTNEVLANLVVLGQ